MIKGFAKRRGLFPYFPKDIFRLTLDLAQGCRIILDAE